MIRFNNDRKKIISDIGNELIKYANSTLVNREGEKLQMIGGKAVVGVHCVDVSKRVFDDFRDVYNNGKYMNGLDIFPKYKLSAFTTPHNSSIQFTFYLRDV